MHDISSWGVLTIGTGIGDPHFVNRRRRCAKGRSSEAGLVSNLRHSKSATGNFASPRGF